MNLFFFGDVEHVEQSLHVEVPGEIWIFFAGCRKNCCQKVYLRDILPDHLHVKHFFVHDVERHVGTGTFEEIVFFAQVGCDDVVITVNLSESECEFHSYLAGGADNKYFLFLHERYLEGGEDRGNCER